MLDNILIILINKYLEKHNSILRYRIKRNGRYYHRVVRIFTEDMYDKLFTFVEDI